MRTRAERRRLRSKKIKGRKKLVSNTQSSWCEMSEYCDGMYSTNNIMNKLMTKGKSKKTRIKNSHSNYRRTGSWGKAVEYKPYDKRQVDEYKDQLKEYKKGNLCE